MAAGRRDVILCADDFGMGQGISEAILKLAERKRLSAASALVTTPSWPHYAAAIASLRDRIAIGLHINLSFGRPLGAMPLFAPAERFAGIRPTIHAALAGRITTHEIAAEVERQLDRFEAHAGFKPDFVDGHHHAHILPGIRGAIIDVLARRFPDRTILIRNPSDRLSSIVNRRTAAAKALAVKLLAHGFAGLVAARGFPSNKSFAGFSSFGGSPFAREFETYFIDAGPRHLVMCHPGLADDDDAAADIVGERRCEEYEVLATHANLPDRIWTPDRRADADAPVVWPMATETRPD